MGGSILSVEERAAEKREYETELKRSHDSFEFEVEAVRVRAYWGGNCWVWDARRRGSTLFGDTAATREKVVSGATWKIGEHLRREQRWKEERAVREAEERARVQAEFDALAPRVEPLLSKAERYKALLRQYPWLVKGQ